MAIPTKCPQCGKNNFAMLNDSHFIPKAVKNREQKFDVNLQEGIFVRSFVCKTCYGVVFVKEVYAKELK